MEREDDMSDIVGKIFPSSGDVQVPAPYLDFMSVSSPTLVPKEECGIHSKLLIEPVAVPSLEHTGLRTSIEKAQQDSQVKSRRGTEFEERPLFYPDGRKKKNFRLDVRRAIQKVKKETDELEEKYSKEASISTRHKKSLTKFSRTQVSNVSTSQRSRREPLLLKSPPRESDKKLREILSGIKKDRQRIDALTLH